MKTQRTDAGSTLAMALITIAVMAFAATSVFYAISNRNQTSANSASWQEALDVAESGVDLGLAALNTSMTDPATAWAKWTPDGSTTANAISFPKTYTGTLPAHTGEGNHNMYVSVKIDNLVTDGNGQVWYRIRASGTTEVPGLRRVGYAPSALTTGGVKYHSNFLRRISYKSDATGGALHHLPQTTRTVEAMAQPLSAGLFSRALLVQKSIAMSGGAYTDSFDSSNPAKSELGQYLLAKRQNHGDIASNSSGNLSDLKKSFVYGNASSNSGTIQDTQNVQGSVYNNFSTTISPVSNPSFPYYTAGPSTVYNPPAAVTLVAGTAAAPANYVLSAINVSNGANPLILAPPVAGQESYINIWVKGDITTSGSGFIKQLPGVHATIWVNGKVTVSGSAFDNENGYASYLTINGVTPADGSTNTYTVSGGATFIGVVNAPSYALTVSGGGDYMGALIMLSANLSGSAGYHYDESLGSIGGGNGLGYKVGSWVEDIR